MALVIFLFKNNLIISSSELVCCSICLCNVESLSLIKKENPEAVVLMITAAGQKEKMIEAIKRGADEFILKPFNEAEIVGALERIDM